MINENSRSSTGKILLIGGAQKLREARNLVQNVPHELHDFCDYLANFIKDPLTPEGFIMLLSCTLGDLKKGKCKFGHISAIPKKLKEEKAEIILSISYFPLIVDRIASKAFSTEFRILFSAYFGQPQPPICEDTEDFGLILIKDGVVNISNKNKAEVLASLYNNSHPEGTGFFQYTPTPMTIEQARALLEQSTEFDFLYGRVMKVSFQNNVIRTAGYNKHNGDGAAERIISHCHNI